jgi:4-aminobutyrate aminotransferase/(S)-3-amino-2-methylpropionate transaminase
VPMSYPYRDPEGMTGEQAAWRALEQIDRLVGAGNVACVLIEPIQGEGGFVVPAPGFLPAIAAWCRDHEVLLAADEIQTGFCRTGDWFACEDEGVVPDLMTTAKALAAGYPLAAVTGRADLMDAVHPGGLGGTYGGNPVACAAALASIDIMRSGELAAVARGIGEVISKTLGRLRASHPAVGDVRGRGAMMAMEIVRSGTSDPDPVATRQIAQACHQAGVIVLTCGSYGNVIRLLPPLVIDEALLADGLAVLASAVDQVLSDTTP